MQSKLVKQDAVAAFCILDELVVGENFDIPVASRQRGEIPLVVGGAVVTSEYLSMQRRR